MDARLTDICKRMPILGLKFLRAKTAEIAGVGHAPMLLDEAQVHVVSDFLHQA